MPIGAITAVTALGKGLVGLGQGLGFGLGYGLGVRIGYEQLYPAVKNTSGDVASSIISWLPGFKEAAGEMEVNRMDENLNPAQNQVASGDLASARSRIRRNNTKPRVINKQGATYNPVSKKISLYENL